LPYPRGTSPTKRSRVRRPHAPPNPSSGLALFCLPSSVTVSVDLIEKDVSRPELVACGASSWPMRRASAERWARVGFRVFCGWTRSNGGRGDACSARMVCYADVGVQCGSMALAPARRSRPVHVVGGGPVCSQFSVKTHKNTTANSELQVRFWPERRPWLKPSQCP
jgi:hypothetical protein